MFKKFFSIFAIAAIFLSQGGFGLVGTAFAAGATVTTEAELIAAIASSTASTDVITIGTDFALTSQLYVNKPLTIDGANKTISGKEITITVSDVTIENLKVDNSNLYGIQAYTDPGVNPISNIILKNISVSNSTKGGIVVNNSNVTLDGTITLNNNAWGGIDVSKGTPTLDINGAIINFLGNGFMIWSDDNSAIVIDISDNYTKAYYALGKFSYINTSCISNQSQLVAAVNDSVNSIDSIALCKDIYLTNKITLTKGLVIEGGEHTLSLSAKPTRGGTPDQNSMYTGGGDFILKVANEANVSISGLVFSGGDAAMMILEGSKVTTNNVIISNTQFGGVAVKSQSGTLNIGSLNYDDSNLTAAVAWLDNANIENGEIPNYTGANLSIVINPAKPAELWYVKNYSCTNPIVQSVGSLSGWYLGETRLSGHNELTTEGLHVWTEGATSTDKAAGYLPVSFDLNTYGDHSMADNMTIITIQGITPPSQQLVIDFDNDGQADGTLVGESIYGNNWWLTNGSKASVKSNAPHIGGGNGSEYFGTILEWLAKFPNAKVTSIGYSLGSGVYGDYMLKDMRAGCKKYIFKLETIKPTINSQFSGTLTQSSNTYSQTGFDVTTVSNDYTGKMVRVKIEILSGDKSKINLSYLQGSQYYSLDLASGTAYYGPSTGFPLGNLTSKFAVTIKDFGVYKYRLSIVDVDTDSTLTEKEFNFELKKTATNPGGGSSGGGGGGSYNTPTVPTTGTEVILSGNVQVGCSIENSTYSAEQNAAYQYACGLDITTMDTVQNARVQDHITRAEFAKMMSNYAKNVLNKEPNSKKLCKFPDADEVNAELARYMVTACQYNIMGIDMVDNMFLPNQMISRAEVVTVLSRLYDLAQDGTPYYVNHMAAMKAKGFITVTTPDMLEVRGYVFIMLERIAEAMGK